MHNIDQSTTMEEKAQTFFNKVFETYMKTIKDGIPDLQIPSLDPLEIPGKQEIQLESFVAYIDASFSDVELEGLSTMNPPKLELQDNMRKIHTATSTEKIKAKGNYTLNGHALKFMSISSDSTFTCDVACITVTIDLELTNKETDAFDPKVKVEIKFEDMKLELNGNDSKIVAFMINPLLSSFSSMISKFLQKTLGEMLQQVLQKVIDQLKDEFAAGIESELKQQDKSAPPE